MKNTIENFSSIFFDDIIATGFDLKPTKINKSINKFNDMLIYEI